MKRKVLSIILSLLLVLMMIPQTAIAIEAQSNDVVIVFTGGIQGGVMDNITLAGVTAYVNEQKALSNYVELVDAGNALSGTTLTATSNGEFAVRSMNLAGYSLMVPGKRDLAYGNDRLKALQTISNFDYVSFNYQYSNKWYVIKKYGDKKIAYVGITDPLTLGYPETEDASPFYAQVQSVISNAVADGADYIICVGNLSQKSQGTYSAESVIKNTSGINAFINTGTGTSTSGKEVKSLDSKMCLLASPGTDLSSFGVMTISNDEIKTLLVKAYQYQDINVKDSITNLSNLYSQSLNETFADTAYKLYAANAAGVRTIESAETNLGDLVADAYRMAANSDVALVDASEIRSNIEAGPITYNSIMQVVNGNDEISVVKLAGYELYDVLEMSARRYPERNSHFLQVSGLKFDIQQTVPSSVSVDPSGSFVSVDGDYRVTNVKVNGIDIDPMKTYTVAATNSLLEGTTGYSMLQVKQISNRDIISDSQAIVKYISENLKGSVSSVYQLGQGRIDSIKLARQSEIDAEIEKLAEEKLAESNEYNLSLQQQIKDLKEIIAIKDLSIKASSKFTKSGSTRKITVTIKPSETIDGVKYQYYRAVGSTGKYYKKVSKSGLTYANTSVTKGKTYYYKVRAYKYIDGKYYYSDWSNKVSRKVSK